MHIRATYGTHRMHTYMHVCIRAVNVCARINACICTYLTSLKQYIDLTGAVCVRIPSIYVQILTPCWGHRMHVYARICTYFFQHFGANTCTYILSRCCHSCFAPVSALSPRGHYGKFVARQRKRRQIAKFNQIRSARPISAQPAPATWTGTPRLCHGYLGNNGAAKSR